MRINRRSLLVTIITILLIAFLVGYRLPYYIYKPGGADALNPIVEVSNGFESQGDMHLVTVRGGPATPIQYIWASLRPHHEIEPISEVFPEGISQDDYHQAQLQMMENSQKSSTIVAYQAAQADIKTEFEGVYVVSVLEEMPADGILETGDKILDIDDQLIQNTDQLINLVSAKDPGTKINVTIERNEEKLEKEMILEMFPDQEKVGMGIGLVTNIIIDHVNPQVEFASGNIGGPSAGLMFSLEIYDQLTEDDITKGHHIAGTGEINYEGMIGRIGGIDKKVVAADKADCDIFFAPNEQGVENSNYQEAKRTAEEIGTDMKIVPVDTFEDALTYLEDIDPK